MGERGEVEGRSDVAAPPARSAAARERDGGEVVCGLAATIMQCLHELCHTCAIGSRAGAP